ncbi:MAG: hypothetical protein PVJ73_13670 [Acidobacteriota bacterium]|jgi:hypothetical protein
MRRALFVCMCVVAAGCVTAQTQRLDSDVRPARAPESVVVFEEAPERPYTTIARVESRADNVFKDYGDLRAKIVDEAAQLGGEAVILGPESKETEFIILTTGMIASEKKKLAGEVIVFR